MENITTITNEVLYQQYPDLHRQASEALCDEQSYPAVDAWTVEKDSQGTVTVVYEPIFADWYKK